MVPLRNERRLRYQDWVAGQRRALVRELSQGRLGYLHIPDMMGEGWAHFYRDLRTEMGRDGLIFDVRANNGGHISQLVVEKLARRVIAWGVDRWQRPETYPFRFVHRQRIYFRVARFGARRWRSGELFLAASRCEVAARFDLLCELRARLECHQRTDSVGLDLEWLRAKRLLRQQSRRHFFGRVRRGRNGRS